MHGCVLLPREVTSVTRDAVYLMFLYNTSFAVFNVVRIVRFRLFFMRDNSKADVKITSLCILPYATTTTTTTILYLLEPLKDIFTWQVTKLQ